MKNYIIKIEPETSHISERIHFTLKNLPADSKVTIKAFSNDYYCINSDIRYTPDNSVWSSSEVFYTDSNGTLDLSKTAPIKGSYEKADEMGLLYSMKTTMHKNKSLIKTLSKASENRSHTIKFAITIGNDTFTKSIKRYYCTDDILSKDINYGILKGRFFVNRDDKKHAAVIVLSGSDGRIEKAQAIAQCLAMERFAALAVCYFGMDGVSATLENIPLEIVDEAVKFLKSENNVNENKIGIYGRSKGGEMALEAASRNKDITCTAVTSPSCITYSGITAKTRNSKNSSWSYNGKGISFMQFHIADSLKMIFKLIKKDRKALNSLYAGTLKDCNKFMIPLEKINGPILFITSDEDEVWPSHEFGRMASSYLKEKNFKHIFTLKNYRFAGHMMTLPYQSAEKDKYIARSLEDFVQGGIDSWNDTITFFKQWAES